MYGLMRKQTSKTRITAFASFSRLLIIIGGASVLLGSSLRVAAQWQNAYTESVLLAARPTSPTPHGLPGFTTYATAAPSLIRLPDYDLWNALEPVTLTDSPTAPIWRVSDAGWHAPPDWSGLPGEGGNVVMAGHSPTFDPSVWSHSVFRQLAYLRAGDRIEVTAGAVFRYRVAQVFSIPEGQAAEPAATVWIARGTDERLTLITCWPPHTAAYRVIVVAYPEPEEVQ
jgi:LPXTG-site transpeptidase (sortase) family protein